MLESPVVVLSGPEEEVAQKSKALAKAYSTDGKPGRAFAHLLVCLELRRDWSLELEPLFVDTLAAWSKKLEERNQYSPLFECYEQALRIYPDNVFILTALGACLYRENYFKEALKYFKLAIYNKSNYLPAWNGVENVKNILVERWHFRMLNDNERNMAFYTAINRCPRVVHSKVLDIGAGTGLLSLFAAEANASKVYACDYSEAMADIAQSVFEANEVSDKVVILKKLSTDIRIPEDIPERIPVVVTETFDAALFGEDILETAIHAWESLLVHEGDDNRKSVFLPMKAKVFGCLVESIEIARKHHLLPDTRNLKEWISDLHIGTIRPHNSTEYDTENLKTISGGFKMLSAPFMLFEVDFNDLKDLKSHYEGSKSHVQLTVSCANSGYADAVAVWFELFADGEDVCLCTSPFSTIPSCWDQAIFPSHQSTLLEKGKEVVINSSCEKGRLTVSCDLNPKRGESFPCWEPVSWKVSLPVVRFLNNKSMLCTLSSYVDKIKVEKPEWCRIVDTSPFPVFGSLMAKNSYTHLTVCRKTDEDFTSITEVLKRNGVSGSAVTTKTLHDFIEEQPKELDVIFVNLVSSTGELDEEIIKHVQLFRTFLRKGGTLLPKKLRIYCQVVESEYFLNTSQVVNEHLKKYKIPHLINDYKVQHHIDVNLHSVSYIPLTPAIPLARLHLSLVESGGNYNFSADCPVSKPGQVNAIIYWFEYEVSTKFKCSTNTRDSDCNQAAAVIYDQRFVNKGSKLLVNLQYLDGILKFGLNYK